jgi:4-aminobutyrate aminotransferase-like enzyme
VSESIRLETAPVIEGYDLSAERARYNFPDAVVAGRRLNRGTCTIEITGEMDSGRLRAARKRHMESMFVTTHGLDAPVLELGYPVAGHYVLCEAGTYMDLMLGCAQKIVDENHPNFRAVLDRLAEYGLLMRREINTDDYLALAPGVEGIYTPQDLADLLNRAAQDRFPVDGGYRCFFCNSGTEAVEAGMKIAALVRWRKLEESHGRAVIEDLMRQLEIPVNPLLDGDRSRSEPMWSDYPVFFFACEGAFHGRTLGALSLTHTKKAHQIGFPKLRWVRHVPYNSGGAGLERLLDPRSLPEILASDGGVRVVLEQGKVPVDLIASFVAEPFQGEGGYVPGERRFFSEIGEVLRRHGIPFHADEVQSFGRMGTLFGFEQMGVTPSIVSLAKCHFLGAMVAPAAWSKYLHGGWHSNTYGSGKVLDVNMACATVDTLLHCRDPLFEGRDLLENSRIKGEYLRTLLHRVRERHPEILRDVRGIGAMNGMTVRHREAIIEKGWAMGLKMLGCGLGGEESPIRILLLADCLTKEVEDFVRRFDEVLSAVESDLGMGGP